MENLNGDHFHNLVQNFVQVQVQVHWSIAQFSPSHGLDLFNDDTRPSGHISRPNHQVMI